MADKRDYYEVLGLQKGASADEIKGAYRKAALKWHPDRWVSGTDEEKKKAEAMFKEASEAYSVLSDPDKKAKYDQFGFAGVDGGASQDWSQGFGNLNDILNNLFGGAFGGFSGFGGGGGFSGFGGFGGGQQQSRTIRGRDIRTRVKVTLSDIVRGCTKEVSIERNRPCPVCSGLGAKSSSDIRTCPTCKGAGYVQNYVNSIFGRTMSQSVCPQCSGEGKVVSNPCNSCKGTGLVRKKETIRVNIPAGVEDGMQISVHGEGHSAARGGINGDLLVVVEEQQHPQLKRDGVNLFYTRVISVTDAILGTDVTIPSLDGDQTLKIEPGTQSGTVIKLRGKGMPSVNGYGRGDLYVKVLVWIPRKLNRSEKDLVESLGRSLSVKPDPNREDRELFEKESRYF